MQALIHPLHLNIRRNGTGRLKNRNSSFSQILSGPLLFFEKLLMFQENLHHCGYFEYSRFYEKLNRPEIFKWLAMVIDQ